MGEEAHRADDSLAAFRGSEYRDEPRRAAHVHEFWTPYIRTQTTLLPKVMRDLQGRSAFGLLTDCSLRSVQGKLSGRSTMRAPSLYSTICDTVIANRGV